MRVAYLINQYPAVSHTFIRREIRALESQGIQIERFSIRRWRDRLVDAADKEELAKTRCIQSVGVVAILFSVLAMSLARPLRFAAMLALALRMSRSSDRNILVHLAYLAEACQLARWLRGSTAEHMHAHFGTNSAEVAMFAHGLGAPPYSFTVHGPEEFDRPALLGIREKVRRSKFVVAVSSYGRSQLLRWVDKRDRRKVKVIHCGLEEPLMSNAAPRAPAPPRLVCVGRLSAQKGQLLLVEATARLAGKGVAFQLILAGDGEAREEIEEFIRKNNLASRVRITGWITGEQVLEELAAARALVLPSFAEGLPVVIMEAMAVGRPVLSTYIAGIPELVRNGEDGWLVPAGDVDALAERMEAILKASVEELARMGSAARARVRERHAIVASAAALACAFAESSATGFAS